MNNTGRNYAELRIDIYVQSFNYLNDKIVSECEMSILVMHE